MFSERVGKGARVPPRDALLSRAGRELGHGFAFGLHEALDKTGAVLGPLLVAAAVAWSGYRLGFAALAVPAVLALLFLLRARGVEPEPAHKHAVAGDAHFDARYYLYLAFSVISVFGFAQYILVAYHLQVAHRLAPALIPVLYGLAMGVDALAALASGRIFDRHGLKVLILLPLLSLPAIPLLFLASDPTYIWLGAVCWGAALGVQQSTVRAGVATLTPEHKRGTAYGIFDSAFGLALLLGSLLLGELYSLSITWLVIVAVAFQVAALAFAVRHPAHEREGQNLRAGLVALGAGLWLRFPGFHRRLRGRCRRSRRFLHGRRRGEGTRVVGRQQRRIVGVRSGVVVSRLRSGRRHRDPCTGPACRAGA